MHTPSKLRPSTGMFTRELGRSFAVEFSAHASSGHIPDEPLNDGEFPVLVTLSHNLRTTRVVIVCPSQASQDLVFNLTRFKMLQVSLIGRHGPDGIAFVAVYNRQIGQLPIFARSPEEK